MEHYAMITPPQLPGGQGGRSLWQGRSMMSPPSLLATFVVPVLLLAIPCAADPLPVYDDVLLNGFEDWSWAVHDMDQTAVVHSGFRAISLQAVDWAGLYFARPAGVDAAANGDLELWVHGGSSGGQQIQVAVYASGNELASAEFAPFVSGGIIPAGYWAKATISLAALGITSGTFDGIVLMAGTAAAQETVYFDDLVLLETGGATGVDVIPAAHCLLGAAPNPFNPGTTIRFDLPEAGPVRLSVFDVSGRLVRALVDESKSQGLYEAVWDGRDSSGKEVSSGTYLARLRFGGRVETVRMGLVR